MLDHISYLFLVFVLFIGISACDRSAANEPDEYELEPTALPANILAHTEGLIAVDEPLFVILNESIDDPAAVNVSLQPEVAGEWTVQESTLRFAPTDGWRSGQEYLATVTGGGLDGYLFKFRTAPREAELISDGFFIADDDSGELRGRLLTSTPVALKEVAAAIKAEQGGRTLDVEVVAGADDRSFNYRIPLTDRADAPDPVVVRFSGERAGFRGSDTEINVSVPSANSFEVLNVSPDEVTDGIIIQFSQNVDARQDFAGLVEINGGTKFTTRVEGNRLYLFPTNLGNGSLEVKMAAGVAAADGKATLDAESSYEVRMTVAEPQLRGVGKGMIVPYAGDRLFTFEAVGLHSVYLEILEIFPNNVLQHLQEDGFGYEPGDWSLRKVGKVVVRKKVALSKLNSRARTSTWSRYALDLDEYIGDEASALYQIRLGFGMEDVASGCDATLADFGLESLEKLMNEPEFDYGFQRDESRIGNYPTIYGRYDGYSYRDREDMCKPAYYNRERFLTSTMLSTNLGLIAKLGAGKSVVVIATDLIRAQPRSGVQVKAYNYQQQEIGSGKTDADGSVTMTLKEEPTFFRAAHDDDYAYLSLRNSNGLALGRFDVGGSAVKGGLKGNFYTERGVWRPGDSVYLNFVVQDEMDVLPNNYPVNFSLRDAQGRVVERRTVYPKGKSLLYPLWFKTGREDVTGNWSATVEAGGRSFVHNLMIETVKPNRLTVDLSATASQVSPQNNQVTIASDWLYGAPGSGLEAKVEMKVQARKNAFSAYESYTFQDPARRIENTSSQQVFEGQLNAEGEAVFSLPLSESLYPGPVQADLSSKVFEPGGNFSIGRQRLPFDPFTHYVGVDVPRSRWGAKRIARDGTTAVPVVSVGLDGKPAGGRRLTAGVYRLDWSYWWQDNNDNVARWNGSQHTDAVGTFATRTNADGRGTLKVSVPRWGRYLLRVCDAESGHCTGEYFYAGYNTGEVQDREQASLLQVRTDKESVQVGERVEFSVPSSEGGNILVSLETTAGSIRRFWVPAKGGETNISFATSKDMVPTVYATVQLLQPYEQTTNDRPVRLFGVQPFEVTDPATQLEPKIVTAGEYRPQSVASVMVSEQTGKAMTYTLAVVDEGLLGLTRFKTPNLHDKFYAKEALQVKTHDVYEYVMGSINGEFGKVLAIGGGEGETNPEDEKANRFEPVVRFLGPFELGAGKRRKHNVAIPNYVGAVRVMVVGSSQGAYGSTDERVPVVQPLMVIPTLPRVLGPGERVDMPVTVVSMDEGIRDVGLEVTEREGLAVPGTKQQLSFSERGERLAYVPVTVGERTGIARFDVRGNAGSEKASQEIEIDVRHPNTMVYRNQIEEVPAGQRKTIDYQNFGTDGTREATLELSAFPSLNLTRHLNYLLRYPYGCVEQTTSPAFAQVHISDVLDLTDEQKERARNNVIGGLKRMRAFQTSGGGMGYWPGASTPHPWASNYVLHFMAEAKKKGYAVPADVLANLVSFQRKTARSWTVNSNTNLYVSSGQLYRDQAYRLYALAVAGFPEVGAMNKLRQNFSDIPLAGRYQLMAAYALLGRETTAKDLLAKVGDAKVEAYRELGYTFGSQLRDVALVLNALNDMGETEMAGKQAFYLADLINARDYLNTQEAAWTFVSLSSYTDDSKADWTASVEVPGASTLNVKSSTTITTVTLPVDQTSGSVTIINTGQVPVYANVIRGGRPAPGKEVVESQNLVLSVRYVDAEGNEIDVNRLSSGTEFFAEYTVRNPGTLGTGYRQMALETLLPSGWEVRNDRLQGQSRKNDPYEYQDFRDDRVYTFFHLGRNDSKTFTFAMTATYPGRYYLPAQRSNAMYADNIQAGTTGQWVEVLR